MSLLNYRCKFFGTCLEELIKLMASVKTLSWSVSRPVLEPGSFGVRSKDNHFLDRVD